MKRNSNTTVAIARFKENLDWLHKITSPVDILVYNNGEPLSGLPENVSVIQSPNLFPDHVWLNFIIQNYSNLPDWTIFLQAYPFDHFKETLECLNQESRSFRPYCNEYIPFAKGPHPSANWDTITTDFITCFFDIPDQWQVPYGNQWCIDRDRILFRPIELYNTFYKFYERHSDHRYVFERFWQFVLDLKTPLRVDYQNCLKAL